MALDAEEALAELASDVNIAVKIALTSGLTKKEIADELRYHADQLEKDNA